MQSKIELTVEESLAYAQKVAKLDGFVEGVAAFAEYEKKALIQSLVASKGSSSQPQAIERKQENGPIAKPQHEPAGHQPHPADEPIPKIQSAGTADESERASVSDGIATCGAIFPVNGTTEFDSYLRQSVD